VHPARVVVEERAVARRDAAGDRIHDIHRRTQQA
jgi:hypothetical protein